MKRGTWRQYVCSIMDDGTVMPLYLPSTVYLAGRLKLP